MAAQFHMTALANGAASVVSGANVMGINSFADGQYTTFLEGFPLFKNRIREASGFGTAATYNAQVALNSAGWPTADFQVILFNGTQQSWGVGNFSCGFIGSGSETISAVNSATVSNIVHGSGGAYTTFTLTSTTALGGGANFGFSVTGTSGAITNIFAYLPEYNTLNTIDNPASASAFTAEAVSFYRQFSFMRLMWYSNSQSNTTQMTSANRNTPANTQTQTLGLNGGFNTYALSSSPGSTSATLASTWAGATGNYAVIFYSTTGGADQARNVTLTQGSTTTFTWSNALSGSYEATAAIGIEGAPIEWMIALANATGTMGLWINIPAWEDGTDGSPGSYSTAVLQLLASSYTSSGPLYFERGNENFWNTYFCTPVLNNLLSVASGSYSDVLDYMAYGAHAFANLARSYLPSGWWGARAFQVEGSQAVVGGFGSYYTADYLGSLDTRSGGNPGADVQYIALAPYVNPTIGGSDSVATIESNVYSWLTSQAPDWGAEQTDIVARNYGLKGLVTYESGIQWNTVSGTSNANVGAAIMDSGMTAPIRAIYQQYANFGFQAYGHFAAGVYVSSMYANAAPVNELSTNYSTLISSGSPTLAAIQPFEAAQTITRNVVSGSGSSFSGANWADNIGVTDGTFSQAWTGVPNLSFFDTGYCLYRVWNPTAASLVLTLSVTFSGVSGSPTSNLIVNGTTVASGVAVSNGVVTFGSVTLRQGTISLCSGSRARKP